MFIRLSPMSRLGAEQASSVISRALPTSPAASLQHFPFSVAHSSVSSSMCSSIKLRSFIITAARLRTGVSRQAG